MTQASAYSACKQAIVSRLEGRAGLAGVNVSYQAPVNVPDVRARGSWESVFLDGATGGFADVILCAGQLRFDEDYVQTLVIQVLRGSSLGTQRAADERAEEILYEVHAELSDQKDWDFDALGALADFDYFQVTPVSQNWVTGFLPGGAGHAARCELGLRVMARRSFP